MYTTKLAWKSSDTLGTGLGGGFDSHRDDQQDETMGRTIKKLTYMEFMKFTEDGNRHEIIEGKEFMTASARRRHARSSAAEIFARIPAIVGANIICTAATRINVRRARC